jgi:ADP-L-glycero-D-manno-heptose 6-epimerase
MKSLIAKAYDRVVAEGKMVLFKSYRPDVADGEQKRDFIYVKDVVNVMRFFMQKSGVNGIFNVGTGHARTWNDLARALFTAAGKSPVIEFVPMPDVLQKKYQYFTQADMTRLQQAGYDQPFTSLESAVKDYAAYLKDKATI